MVQLGPPGARRAIDRSDDRLVALISVGGALAFLVAGLLATLLPPTLRHGIWLPIHLVFAGGATTAIAGVMPFFSAAFAAAPPMDFRLRISSVAAVMLGAIGVAGGMVAGYPWVAAASGVLYVAGVGLIAVATLRPLGRGLGPSRGLVVKGYAIALINVAVGASLAVLTLAAVDVVSTAWAALRVSHAWLNLIGFVSLVIATTLLHFFPTVIGARIATRPTARAVVVCLALGPALVALAMPLGVDLIAQAGALLVEAGALSLLAYCVTVWPTRGKWTTDRAWHLFSMGGLISAVAWFNVGTAIAAGRVLVMGASPGSWDASYVIAPLAVGWVGMAVIASANHLVPSIGPGDAATHGRQRRVLGNLALTRLLVINAGTALLALGLPENSTVIAAIGIALIGGGVLATALLTLWAVALGLRPRRVSRPE
jgi:nitrite reductase (NO-forming)